MEEVRFSITSSRGCFGNCSFCSLTFHQGRTVQGRTKESVIREAQQLITMSGFKGYIHDVGGPTANFFQAACAKQLRSGSCTKRECLVPRPCPNLEKSHKTYLDLLRRLRSLDGVKKVFIRSGLRYDFILADPSEDFFKELVAYHISGQLKVAPEHISPRVLSLMNKPSAEVYEQFKERFARLNRQLEKKQYILPYFISSHPGSTLEDAIALACYFRDNRFVPEQVQDFYPTPGTLSTCMYYTGLDPHNMRPVYTAKGQREKAAQRALMQYRHPKNKSLVLAALKKAGREDLIGYGPHCLVRPDKSNTGKPRRWKQTRSKRS